LAASGKHQYKRDDRAPRAGRHPKRDENVIILNEYANTSSTGSIIAFHKHSEDMAAGDIGLICRFGAGYSAGTVT
jgi:beta-ketodecanoyl-[acyl-carrier-protein] synthase